MLNARRNANRSAQAARARQERRIATIVSQQILAAIPLVIQAIQQAQPSASTNAGGYKSFTSCHPPNYSGKEGATALLQWFERMETVFCVSECPEHQKVKFAASMFTQRALTWWNQTKISLIGLENANEMSWNEFKELLLAEFCPRNELKKLEAEFWELKQEGGNSIEYTTRFHELSLLVPHMVTPPDVAIDRYVDGLPLKVRTHVMGNCPATVGHAIQLAASITDALVKEGKLERKETGEEKEEVENKRKKKADDSESNEAEEPTKKKKTETAPVYAATVPHNPITPPAPQQPQFTMPQAYVQPTQPRQNYTGLYPLCSTCGYHHLMGQACRLCTQCNRYGHWAYACRRGAPPTFAPTPLNTIYPDNRIFRNGCFTCGDVNHYARNCPQNRLAPVPVQIPPINAAVNQVQPNPH